MDKVQEIQRRLELNVGQYHKDKIALDEDVEYLLTELDTANKKMALLENDKEFFIKETNSTLKQLYTAEQENERLQNYLEVERDMKSKYRQLFDECEQQLKQAIEALEGIAKNEKSLHASKALSLIRKEDQDG